MATPPSNPGWSTGYVPSAEEWAAAFSSKVDYPASLDQGGTGGKTSAAANYNLVQRSLISTSTTLKPLNWYGLSTSVGPLSLGLPPLSSFLPGDWIELYDVDFNANINNVTVTASTGDVIALYNATAASRIIDVAGARVLLVVNTSSWRMVV